MKFSQGYLSVCLTLVLFFSIPGIGFSQFGQNKITFSVGGQYVQPLSGFNQYQNYGSGIGLEVLDMYELSFIKDNLLIFGFSSYNFHNPKKINNEPIINKSIQVLQGLGYNLKPIFFGAGIGYTFFTNQDKYTNAATFSTYLALGMDLTKNLRIASKYVSSNQKQYQSISGYGLKTIKYNSLSIGFHYVLGMK